MQSLDIRRAGQIINKKLRLIVQKNPDGNVLLGVAGCVASGKSRLSQKVRHDASSILKRELFYLPFDLWINAKGLHSSTYAGRFFLDDFICAIQCISARKYFLIPRYDLTKKDKLNFVMKTKQQIVWNNKQFFGCLCEADITPPPGTIGLFVEKKTGNLYSLFPAVSKKTFLVDGTLIFPKEAIDKFDISIFVQADWPLRISRMIRRFNRKEVFGLTTQSMAEYVGFLVDEAKMCADAEIFEQLSDEMILVESVPETLSNYLDLRFFYAQLRQHSIPAWVTTEDVETSVQSFLNNIKKEKNMRHRELLRRELTNLIESKHLLALDGTDQILSELTHIINI